MVVLTSLASKAAPGLTLGDSCPSWVSQTHVLRTAVEVVGDAPVALRSLLARPFSLSFHTAHLTIMCECDRQAASTIRRAL